LSKKNIKLVPKRKNNSLERPNVILRPPETDEEPYNLLLFPPISVKTPNPLEMFVNPDTIRADTGNIFA